MKSALKIMEGVRALLSGPDKWTKGAMAKNSKKQLVGPTNEDAQCWCVSGAIAHVCGGVNEEWTRGMWALSKAISDDSPEGVSIPFWNDFGSRTYADVVAMIDKTIEREKEQPTL